MLGPRKWADPGTVEVFIDHVEGPHRPGAGDLWDVDQFWVQVGWEGYSFLRTRVYSAQACEGEVDENSLSAVAVTSVGERLVLPLLRDCDFEETGVVLKASLHEADVVCRTSTEVGSCLVPARRSRSSIPMYYMLTDCHGNSKGRLNLAVSLPEFPEHPTSCEQRRKHFTERNMGPSLQDLWAPLVHIFSCGCDSSCEQPQAKHIIIRTAHAPEGCGYNKQRWPSNFDDEHPGPIDPGGANAIPKVGYA